jgi:hypothetical protein
MRLHVFQITALNVDLKDNYLDGTDSLSAHL